MRFQTAASCEPTIVSLPVTAAVIIFPYTELNIPDIHEAPQIMLSQFVAKLTYIIYTYTVHEHIQYSLQYTRIYTIRTATFPSFNGKSRERIIGCQRADLVPKPEIVKDKQRAVGINVSVK